jgi:hypothetical protein
MLQKSSLGLGIRGIKAKLMALCAIHYRKRLFFGGHDYFRQFVVWPPKIQIFSAVSLVHQKYRHFWQFFPIEPLKLIGPPKIAKFSLLPCPAGPLTRARDQSSPSRHHTLPPSTAT